ncbi:MmpS family transport accessory protein [Mycobacteroides abscessus]|uniref:MmpS family transport accessory protein n=1 Tax=Mycobacteroides abscessus TaxID=36809 RepID=UPI0009A6BC90|nr:MmpS family transport accessory protein [Mycobacteroides abscessus]
MSVSTSRTLVQQLWLPLVVLAVLIVTGAAIESLHGIFGSVDRTHSIAGNSAAVQFNLKKIRYEVSGDLGGWGRVSYWNVESKPVDTYLVTLPWTHTETTVLTTATADITAQVAGGNARCRIIVDGVVRSEHAATGEHAGVWCQVLSA